MSVAVPRPLSSSKTEARLDEATIAFYRENGFARIEQVLTPKEIEYFRRAAFAVIERMSSYRSDAILDQRVNVWRQDQALGGLTLHPRIAACAEQLAGAPLRLWHDQLLVKHPGESAATEFHQDQPYWPHDESYSPLSAWVALVDIPAERGCMSFLPGSHHLRHIPRHELNSAQGLFDLAPDLRFSPRVMLPLRAGDCTFHHGRTAHFASPNRTADPRLAHAIIYVDATTVYNGARHVVTDPLQMKPGAILEGELFPLVSDIRAGH